MYSAVLMAVIAAAGQGCPAGGCGPTAKGPHGLAFGFAGGGYPGWGCCGMIAPQLLGGTAGPAVGQGEELVWRAYLAELEFDDRAAMADVWAKADFDGRRKILGMLGQLRADQAKEKQDAEDKLPLTEMDQERWQKHLKTLKGDLLKKAQDDWDKADLKARRSLLRALPKK